MYNFIPTLQQHCVIYTVNYKCHLTGKNLLVLMVPTLEESTKVYYDSGSFLCCNYVVIAKRMKNSDTTGLRVFNFLKTSYIHLVESYLLLLVLLGIK